MMPKKKVRRVVLGIGHPWFFDGAELNIIKLYRGHNVFHDPPKISTHGLGNWNKIRLVAEVIK